MKKIYSFRFLLFLKIIYGQCEETEYSTAGVLTTIDVNLFNNDESVNAYSTYSWTSDALNRILNGNGIPNHEVGTFPNPHNPNSISAQNINHSFSLCPEIVHETGIQLGGPGSVIAYAINSVKFDPGTAGRCNNNGECSLGQGQGQWNIEALGHETFDFGDDMNHAHVQPNGQYHYHGIPELLVEFLGGGQNMTLVGWASDGFPVYARYGYTNALDSSSEIISLQSSWRLKSMADEGRPDSLTAMVGGPNQGNSFPNTPIPMGAFTQDFEYAEGHGDLDECNGRFGVTPEFPNGIYYYVVTDEFPFFTRCLKGEISVNGGGGGGIINCEDVPPGAPCCGDNICGGPENSTNCPQDCQIVNIGPSLVNFSVYADTVNTAQDSINLVFMITAEDNDSYLSHAIFQLIYDDDVMNSVEILESVVNFSEGLMSSNIFGVLQLPMGTTNGKWDIRLVLIDEFGASTNIGPATLGSLEFQNYVYIENTVLKNITEKLPLQYKLHQNYPNPFNPVTNLKYDLPEDTFVDISIYDMKGEKIKTLVRSKQKKGNKSIQWNATNDNGTMVSAGLYVYTIQAGEFRKTGKMLFLK